MYVLLDLTLLLSKSHNLNNSEVMCLCIFLMHSPPITYTSTGKGDTARGGAQGVLGKVCTIHPSQECGDKDPLCGERDYTQSIDYLHAINNCHKYVYSCNE